MQNKNLLFLDFETYFNSDNGYTLRKQSLVEYIRDSRYKTLGLGFCGIDAPQWVSAKDVPALFNDIENETGWENVALVCQNAKFDGYILRQVYGILAGQYIDTLAMSRAVLGKTIKSHSLANLAAHFGLVEKGHLNTDGKDTLTVAEEKELAEYCIHDVELTRAIFNKLSPCFPDNQYGIMDQTIRMFVDPKLVLNVPLLEKTSIEEAKRRANIFKEIGIDKSIFASNAKFPKLLIKEGYEVPMKESPRKVDAEGKPLMIPALALGDIEFLELTESEDERLNTLCEARIAAKSTLLETRSAKLANIGRTGHWSFDVEFSGADQTHRFSGGSGAGGNPQNFTRGSALREAVEAPEGYELIVGDFSNIEMRLVAYLAKDPGLIEGIESGRDLYCDFASVFYGRTITKKDEAERRFGKTALLGLGYGMGWKKFTKTVRVQTGQILSEEDARKAVELYRTRYAQVPKLWEKCEAWISLLYGETKPEITPWNFPVSFEKEAVVLPSGLKVRFPNLHQEQGEKYTEWIYEIFHKGHLEKRKLYGGKLVENISQGLAGEITKLAMEQMGDQVYGQVHDELIVLCKKGLSGVVGAKLKRAMSTSPSWLPEIKLDAEIKVGSDWGIK